MRSIGILGFGKLGKFIFNFIENSLDFELSFIWNRSPNILKDVVPEHLILHNIEDIKFKKCDLVIEVCHPNVIYDNGEFILQYCDLLIGSPTVFADEDFKGRILKAANLHAIYIPTGAFWGLEDIRKLDVCHELKSLKITMEKHPNSFKLTGQQKDLNEVSKRKNESSVLFDGSVREICKIAPNNVNTMAVAALAAENLGFDKVQGVLISDPKNDGCHIIYITLESISGLRVTTQRYNPATVGDVTGSATFNSFVQSIKGAIGKKPGLHFC